MKSNYKIKCLLGFVVFFLLFGFVFSKLTWVLRGNSEESREDVVGYKNQENVDVLLYGGSTLLRFYSPLDAWNENGITSYNYATSAAKVDIVKEYIEDSRVINDPILYVIDIRTYPMIIDTVDDASLRNWSDSLPVFSPIRWKGITSFLFTRNWKDVDIPSFYFDIIQYHSNTENLKNPMQWEYVNADNIHNIDRGFLPNLHAVPFAEPPAVVEERGELTVQQANALNELLDYCDRENLQVLFIVCPYYISEKDSKILNTCGDIIQSRGYDFINFNHYYDEIGLDFETDFSDVNHVNYIGAIKYTKYLTNYISENYDIPDHRGEADYIKWDEDYETMATTKEEWYSNQIETISNHLEARDIGEKMYLENDFSQWYQSIQNSNFTVIIKKNTYIDYAYTNATLNAFIDKYGIDMSKEHYVGVWCKNNCIFSTNEDEETNVNIGVDRGRGADQCIVTNGDKSQFSIAGIDYNNSNADLQVVVYDNNYKKVVDNVVITINENGNCYLVR